MPSIWKFSLAGLPFGVSTWPARVSIPLPRGSEIGTGFSVQRPDGTTVPAQARSLTKWPDGSPRWVQLDFQANGGGDHCARIGNGDKSVVHPLSITQECDVTVVSVGRLMVDIDPNAASPLQRITWKGRSLTGTKDVCNFRVLDDAGRVFPVAAGAAHDVKIEAEGNQRFQVSWETEHRDASGLKLLDIRFRLEFLAGVEGFTLSYQFFHKLPGREFLHLQAIEGTFAFDGMIEDHGHSVIAQQSHGLLAMRRMVRTRNTVPIVVDGSQRAAHVEDLACLDDDYPYPYFLATANYIVSPAVGLEDDHAAVTVVMHDMQDLRPKTLTIRPGEVVYGIWPKSAGILKLPQGRSAAQRFSFTFADPNSEEIDNYVAVSRACYLEPAIGWLDAADSVHAGASWDAPRLFNGSEPGVGLFANLFRDAFARYYIAGAMFDFGDSPHFGYTTAYPGTGMRPIDDTTPRNIPFTASLGGYDALAMTSLIAPQDLQPVWANNEYDAIYALALESLRTRNPLALNKLRAASRHQIEVDFVHYSDYWQHHRGTPCHTYDHNACSTAYPSHQWTQGLYYYYCMTGDDDVPEVIRAICDFNIAWLAMPELQINHYFNRELGWGLIALVFGYELTGEEKYRKASEDLIHELEGYSGKNDFDEMYKACSSQIGSNEKQLGSSFGVNTIVMGVRVYHQATGEDWAKELLFRWVEIGFPNYNDKATGPKICDMFPECFTYVCELTGDTRYLRESLWQLTMMLYGFGNIWAGNSPIAGNDPIDAKLYGRLYRGLMLNVSACAKAGLLGPLEAHFLGEPTPTK